MPITPPPTITAVDELNYSLLHIWTNDEGRRTNAETRPARLRRSSLVLRHWRASSTARPLADDRDGSAALGAGNCWRSLVEHIVDERLRLGVERLEPDWVERPVDEVERRLLPDQLGAFRRAEPQLAVAVDLQRAGCAVNCVPVMAARFPFPTSFV